MAYTIKRLKEADVTQQIREFIFYAATQANKAYGNKYNWSRLPIIELMNKHYFAMCFRDGEPVGLLIATLGKNFFDPDIIVLKQNLLFSLPNTRSSYYLLKDFVDFGKTHANYVITSIGTETNIKNNSLEKLGFKKLEEHYRMECK